MFLVNIRLQAETTSSAIWPEDVNGQLLNKKIKNKNWFWDEFSHS